MKSINSQANDCVQGKTDRQNEAVTAGRKKHKVSKEEAGLLLWGVKVRPRAERCPQEDLV